MKLADRYLPGNYFIKRNEIYQHFLPEIKHALRAAGNFDHTRSGIHEGQFVYELTEDEKHFHDQLYVPFGEILSLASNKVFASDLVLGSEEKHFIDRILSEPQTIIPLRGGVGSGKTTFLKHIFFYVIQNSADLRKKILPIYICVDQFTGILNSKDSRDEIIRKFHDVVLFNILKTYTADLYSLDNEELWNFVKSNGEFGDLKVYEKLQVELFEKTGNDKYKENIYIRRARIVETDAFQVALLRYERNTTGRIPVIIYDNIDPLDAEVQDALLRDAVDLTEQKGFTAIFPLRPVAFNRLAAMRSLVNSALGIQPFDLHEVDVRTYVQKRMEAMLKKTQVGGYQIELIAEGKTIQIQQARDALQAMVEVLFNESSNRLLTNISNRNYRKLNNLIDIYLSSGYIREWGLYNSIIGKVIADDGQNKPPRALWVLLSSILTSNYGTHFSRSNNPNPELLRSIINMYCNQGDEGYNINPYFIRLHLLNYLSRRESCSGQDIVQAYCRLFDSEKHHEVERCINHALQRFMYGELIETHEKFMPDNDDIVSIKTLGITQTGEYYLHVFRNYYEYLCFMKDDVHLFGDVNFQSAIECKGHRRQMYADVENFLVYFVNKEIQFLGDLDSQDKRCAFKENFACVEPHSIFTMYDPVKKLFDYIPTEWNIDPKNLERLLNTMNNFEWNYLGGLDCA